MGLMSTKCTQHLHVNCKWIICSGPYVQKHLINAVVCKVFCFVVGVCSYCNLLYVFYHRVQLKNSLFWLTLSSLYINNYKYKSSLQFGQEQPTWWHNPVVQVNNDCWLTAELVICQQQRLTNWNILQCTGGLGSFVLLYLANATLSTGMLVLEKPLQTAPGVQVKSRTILLQTKKINP